MKISKYLILISTTLFILSQTKYIFANNFNLYLYFDGNIVRFDNRSNNKFEYVVKEGVDRYKQESLDDKYKVQIISKDIITYSKIITPPDKASAFVISLPDINIADKIQIISNNIVIDEIIVSQYRTCNQNFVCEYEKGEDTNTCISDCIGDNVEFSEETIRTLQAQNGVIRNEEGVVLLSNNAPDPATPTDPETNSNSSNILLLIGGILFLVAGVGVFIWKLRRR